LLPISWRLAGKCAQRVSTSIWFGHFRYLVKVAEKISNTLWAFPKEALIAFRCFSNNLHKLLDTFPSEPWHNLVVSFTFPLKQSISVY
jgi:hypothetical protein